MLSFVVLALATMLLSTAAQDVVTLPELLASTPDYSILAALLNYTGLLEPLSMTPDITIFAPTNFGFKETASDIGCDVSMFKFIAQCFKKIGNETLSTTLKYHVVPSALSSDDVMNKNRFNTLAEVIFNRRGPRLNDQNEDLMNPKLVTSKLDAIYQYGYVHGINRLLMLDLDFDGGEDDGGEDDGGEDDGGEDDGGEDDGGEDDGGEDDGGEDDGGDDGEGEMKPGLVELLEMSGRFSMVLHFLDMANLTEMVSQLEGVTIFVPTNRAIMLTLEAAGCPDAMNSTEIIACAGGFVSNETISELFMYHITMGLFPSEIVNTTNLYTMLNDVYLYRHKDAFIDQAPGYPNAFLAKNATDLMYDNGIVHGIGRVMLPFRTLTTPDPCDVFEFPTSLADTSYLQPFKIVDSIRRCPPVLAAVNDCDVNESLVCDEGRGAETAIDDVTIGRAILAAKTCDNVVVALRACPDSM